MAKLSAYGQQEVVRVRKVYRSGYRDLRVTLAIMDNGRILRKTQVVNDITGRYEPGSWKVYRSASNQPTYRTVERLVEAGYVVIRRGGVVVPRR